MTHTVLVGAAAATDVAAAFAWYNMQRAGLGDEFLAELDSALSRIAEGPRRYQAIHKHIRRATMRRFPYSVYFFSDETVVTVLAVLHQRRSPAAWQRRD